MWRVRDGAAAEAADEPPVCLLGDLAAMAAAARALGVSAAEIVVDINDCVHAVPNRKGQLCYCLYYCRQYAREPRGVRGVMS